MKIIENSCKILIRKTPYIGRGTILFKLYKSPKLLIKGKIAN